MLSATAQNKIHQFQIDDADKLHIVADFDRTLTKGIPGYVGATTWGLISQFLSAEGKLIQKQLYDKYRVLEYEGVLTADEAVHWWETSLQNYVSAHLSFADIKQTICERLSPRKGVKELFTVAANYHIPIVILSAGIKNIIDYWCASNGFAPTLVLSTELILSDDEHIIGWKKENLIHVLNKNEHSNLFTGHIQKERPNILLVGDSLDDAAMASGDANVLRILLDDPSDDEKQLRNETYVGKVQDRFDIHLMEESLLSVVDIIRTISTS